MAENKEKRYVSDNAQLMAEWNWKKNNELGFYPETLTLGSNKKAWWICSKGHEWQARIAHRNDGVACPYCAGQKTIKGINDLQTTNPNLAKEWNYEKNNGLTPMDVLPNSNKKVWWKCNEGHEWQASIANRNSGHGCPYCSGLNAVKGENDLQTINPTIATEWNYEKNGNLKPEDFTANSGKIVWWRCNKGHEWQASIANRNRGNGCPICSSERNTSFPEYAIIYYLKKHGFDVIHSCKANGYELDIYIPSKKIAIEYDGYFWHKNKVKKDLEKNSKCKKDDIKLYRIREELPPLDDSSIDYVVQKNQKNLSEILERVLEEIIGTTVEVDIKRDAIDIENLREHSEKENSLLFSNPALEKEWNYEKNGDLKPEHFMANSGKKVWWKCSNGHEWQAKIYHRNNGAGCPNCSGSTGSKKRISKILSNKGSLEILLPSLASEWHPTKNRNLLPSEVTIGSGEKVWWLCNTCGSEWQARISSRSNGAGCPYCSGRYAVKGKNDLQTVNPILAKEWNYEKNNGLMPTDVMPNSSKKVWWKCNKGHEWQATIADRNSGCGCPFCSGQKVLKGYNDLQTVNPFLAKEWHHEKNDELTPADVMPNSHQKVWWKRSCGHEWEAEIRYRNKGRGCPYCSGRKKQ